MIDEQSFFSGFVFPWIVVERDQSIIANDDGSLFPFPTLIHREISQDYCKTVVDGWSECPNGLACFSHKLPNSTNKKFVCYGMKVKGISTLVGKSNVLTIKTNQEAIETLVSRTMRSYSEVENQLINILRSSIHEVRSINTDIYHSALGANNNGGVATNKALKNIVALSGLLKERTDFLDAISNPLMLSIRGGKSDIYRMFDKVIRSLYASSIQKSVRIRLSGDTKGRVEGIQLFSVIPYLMLQNALKYAPRNTEITVNLQEDDDTIYVKTSSWGPLVEKDEFDKIFRSGYRGIHAVEFEKDGTGIGLYFLKQLIEMHDGGSVRFFQDEKSKVIDGTNFAQTHFNLRFQRAD